MILFPLGRFNGYLNIHPVSEFVQLYDYKCMTPDKRVIEFREYVLLMYAHNFFLFHFFLFQR